mmetsp:Transcript_25056/g.56849  ORF Transcript_25056/g.56849 Transcript_25056/m.56849 type:complete len:427 (+) Transcript_25056:284-1564(+)
MERLVRGADAVARAVAQAADAEAHVEVGDRHLAELVAADRPLLLHALLREDAVLLEEFPAGLGVLRHDLEDGGLEVGLGEGVPVLVELLVRLHELLAVPVLEVPGELVEQGEGVLPGRGLGQLALGDVEVRERALDLARLVGIADLLGELQGGLRCVQGDVVVLGQRGHAMQHLDLALRILGGPALLHELLDGVEARVGALHRGGRQDDGAHQVGHARRASALDGRELLLRLGQAVLRGLVHDVALNDELRGGRHGRPAAQVLGGGERILGRREGLLGLLHGEVDLSHEALRRALLELVASVLEEREHLRACLQAVLSAARGVAGLGHREPREGLSLLVGLLLRGGHSRVGQGQGLLLVRVVDVGAHKHVVDRLGLLQGRALLGEDRLRLEAGLQGLGAVAGRHVNLRGRERHGALPGLAADLGQL